MFLKNAKAVLISVFGWPDPNTAFGQSEHALYTCYSIITIPVLALTLGKYGDTKFLQRPTAMVNKLTNTVNNEKITLIYS